MPFLLKIPPGVRQILFDRIFQMGGNKERNELRYIGLEILEVVKIDRRVLVRSKSLQSSAF